MSARFKRGLLAAVFGVVMGLGCGEEDLLSIVPDDAFESNDDFNHAFDLESRTGELLSAHPDNATGYGAAVTPYDWEDYFMITIPGNGDLTIQCTFAADGGEVDLTLYEVSDTGTPLGTSAQISLGGSPEILQETLTLLGVLLNEQYYIHVKLRDEDASAENLYDMIWNVP